MHFVAAVTDAREVEPLVHAGAAELYCGIAEREWTANYGDHDSISRRQGRANLSARADLKALLVEAQATKTPVYLTLNGRYTEPQLPYLLSLCDAFAEMGGEGLQIFDIGLMSRLTQESTPLKLCLSLLAVATNTQTVQVYNEQFSLSRIVVPRFMYPDDCALIHDVFPALEIETMVFGDRCPFVDGYCRFYHGNAYQNKRRACKMGRVLLKEGGKAEDALRTIETYDTTYRTHSCRVLLGEPINEYPCAACDLAAFAKAGVRYMKIGGRGMPLVERLRVLEFLTKAAALSSDQRRRTLYEDTFNTSCNCYREAQERR